MLAHAHDDCTGHWRLLDHLVSCSVCGRAHPSTPRNRSAAMEENFVATMLHRATHRGLTQLARERA